MSWSARILFVQCLLSHGLFIWSKPHPNSEIPDLTVPVDKLNKLAKSGGKLLSICKCDKYAAALLAIIDDFTIKGFRKGHRVPLKWHTAPHTDNVTNLKIYAGQPTLKDYYCHTWVYIFEPRFNIWQCLIEDTVSSNLRLIEDTVSTE